MTIEAVTGLGFPLAWTAGATAVARGTAKLEQSMRLVLLTYPGERVMRPDFGCRLRDFVFDSVTPATEVWVADEVRRALALCEPRVTVESVDVVPDDAADGVVRLVIGYRPLGADGEETMVVDLRTDRDASAGGAG
jgi:hypothetical protein